MLQVLKLLDLAHPLRNALNSRTQELLGLSLEQTALLYRLAESAGQNTITAMVDILERAGLAVRRRNRNADRRQVRVVLTALGSRKIELLQQTGPDINAPLLLGSTNDSIEQKLEQALRSLRTLLLG